jgi:hypothetical protein
MGNGWMGGEPDCPRHSLKGEAIQPWGAEPGNTPTHRGCLEDAGNGYKH